MRTIRFTLAYDGTDFHGWQFQPGRRTVQGCVMEAVRKITQCDAPQVLGSSRTDTGVHAMGQLAAVWTGSAISVEAFPRAMNANLPPDILVRDASEETEYFHPIRNTVCKRYRYVLHDGRQPELFLRRFCWRTGRNAPRLDADAMQRAAECLLGKHDFSAFENRGSEREHSVRTIFDLTVSRGIPAALPGGEIFPLVGRADDFIFMEVEADGFLYNMVRNLVGTLYDVGRGHRPPAWVRETLASRDRDQAGITAPPQGLFLLHVETAATVENPFKKRDL